MKLAITNTMAEQRVRFLGNVMVIANPPLAEAADPFPVPALLEGLPPTLGAPALGVATPTSPAGRSAPLVALAVDAAASVPSL
jgi:hypothetical protein